MKRLMFGSAALAALAACSHPTDPTWSSFGTEAGLAYNDGGFGNSTMNNTLVMTDDEADELVDVLAQVIRRLRDARLLDPVFVEVADTHGIETPLLTVADFKGRPARAGGLVGCGPDVDVAAVLEGDHGPREPADVHGPAVRDLAEARPGRRGRCAVLVDALPDPALGDREPLP